MRFFILCAIASLAYAIPQVPQHYEIYVPRMEGERVCISSIQMTPETELRGPDSKHMEIDHITVTYDPKCEKVRILKGK